MTAILLLCACCCAAESGADGEFLLVAHRGVVTESLTGNSLDSLEETIRRGYTHVEVDIRCTSDGHAVCLHDKNLFRTAGVDRSIDDLSLAELRAQVPGNIVPSFRVYCERCRGRIGLMPDLKGCPRERIDRYAESIKRSLDEYDLWDSALFIGQPHLAKRFAEHGRQAWRIPLAATKKLAADRQPGPGQFVFGHAVSFDAEEVQGFQAMGLPVIVSINTGHYQSSDPLRQGNEDVKKMLGLGVEGLQIDSVYEASVPEKLRRKACN